MKATLATNRRSNRGPDGPLSLLASFGLVFVLAGPVALHAQTADDRIRLTASLEPAEITVGDRALVTIELTLPASEGDIEPRFPTWGTTWGEAEVISVAPPSADLAAETGANGQRIFRQTVEITAFRPGSTSLPPQVVAIPRADKTIRRSTPDDLALTIRSVLPVDLNDRDGAEIEAQPPVPPRALAAPRAFWWTLGSMTLFAAFLFFLLRRRSIQRAAADRPQLAPLPELLAALAPLRTAAPGTGHADLSLAVRRFLGRSLRFPAAESTTSEIRWQLRSRHVPSSVGVAVADVLQACDRIKFAQAVATPADLRSRLERAKTLAEDLDAYLNPPLADKSDAAKPDPPAAAASVRPQGWAS